jgi:kanamycin kinase
MHDALPVNECPFSWSAESRISNAREGIMQGKFYSSQWHVEFSNLYVKSVLEELNSPPPSDQFVVCHGDACAPNTLINNNGQWAGHVDMEKLVVADGWADLAIAAWSTQWNYGPGWENFLYYAYGIDPDMQKIRFYRLLWDLDE